MDSATCGQPKPVRQHEDEQQRQQHRAVGAGGLQRQIGRLHQGEALALALGFHGLAHLGGEEPVAGVLVVGGGGLQATLQGRQLALHLRALVEMRRS